VARRPVDPRLAFRRCGSAGVQPEVWSGAGVRRQEIFTVSVDPERGAAAEYLKGTFHWHIDGTTDPVPAKATMLTARHVATVGGAAEFASTYAAFENLHEHKRKRCEGSRVVHSFESAQRLANPRPTAREVAAWRTMPTRESSLVWKRRDGLCSLAIGATADHVVGLPADESRDVLDELIAGSPRSASATPMTGKSETWSSGTTTACCTVPSHTKRRRNELCTGQRSKATRHGRDRRKSFLHDD